jgi:hypothetical protein
MDRYSIALKKEPPPKPSSEQQKFGPSLAETFFKASINESLMHDYIARLETALHDNTNWQGDWEITPYREPSIGPMSFAGPSSAPIRRTFGQV